MKGIALVGAIVATLVFVPVGPASAAVVSVQVTDILGGGMLTDNSLFMISVVDGTLTVANQPPITLDQGSYTRVVNQTPTQTTCTLESVTSECTQATIVCGATLTPHNLIAAIPDTTFKGSIDGIDVRVGRIAITCIDQQVPRLR